MDKPKVYVVVPNTGDMKVGLWRILYELVVDSRFKVTLSDLNKTNRTPGSHNRNECVKEFLATDNEWFLTIDSDVVPEGNPLEYVTANKDVIGFPTRIAKNARIIWNVFKLDEERESYKFVVTKLRELPADIVECDAVGGGCLLIRRGVLENIEAPFMRVWNEDGTQKWGHDLAFCQKAKESGYKVYFAPGCVCEHFKTVPLADMAFHNGWFNVQDIVDECLLKEKPEKKLYVVGPGRCGTATIARMTKGLHEPHPHIFREAYEVYAGDYSNVSRLLRKLKIRRDYTVPSIADLTQSYVIPEILQVDPEAEFLVLVREPKTFINSTVGRNWYNLGEDHYYDRYRIHPKGGWQLDITQVMKCMWLWLETYKTIFEALNGYDKYSVELTSNIPYRNINATQFIHKQEVIFTKEEEDYFNTNLLPYWEQLKEEYNLNG